MSSTTGTRLVILQVPHVQIPGMARLSPSWFPPMKIRSLAQPALSSAFTTSARCSCPSTLLGSTKAVLSKIQISFYLINNSARE